MTTSSSSDWKPVWVAPSCSVRKETTRSTSGTGLLPMSLVSSPGSRFECTATPAATPLGSAWRVLSPSCAEIVIKGGDGPRDRFESGWGLEAAVIDVDRGFAKARSWAWSERFRLASIEDADGEHGNDLIIGNEAANVFSAGWGIDLVEGRGGNDTIDGGAGPTGSTAATATTSSEAATGTTSSTAAMVSMTSTVVTAPTRASTGKPPSRANYRERLQRPGASLQAGE